VPEDGKKPTQVNEFVGAAGLKIMHLIMTFKVTVNRWLAIGPHPGAMLNCLKMAYPHAYGMAVGPKPSFDERKAFCFLAHDRSNITFVEQPFKQEHAPHHFDLIICDAADVTKDDAKFNTVSHFELIAPIVLDMRKYANALCAVKVRGFLADHVQLFYDMYKNSKTFDMIRSPFMNPNNDEYFVVWSNDVSPNQKDHKSFTQLYYGFVNAMAQCSTPWEQTLNTILINEWRFLNPKQHDYAYQKLIISKHLGLNLEPHIKRFDYRWLAPTPQDVVHEVIRFATKFVPKDKPVYDYCSGKLAVSNALASEGFRVNAVDTDQLINVSTSPNIRCIVQDVVKFVPTQGLHNFVFFHPPDGGFEYKCYTEYEIWFPSISLNELVTKITTHFIDTIVCVPLNHVSMPSLINHTIEEHVMTTHKLIHIHKDKLPPDPIPSMPQPTSLTHTP